MKKVGELFNSSNALENKNDETNVNLFGQNDSLGQIDDDFLP